jgi:hypothetical protein
MAAGTVEKITDLQPLAEQIIDMALGRIDMSAFAPQQGQGLS